VSTRAAAAAPTTAAPVEASQVWSQFADRVSGGSTVVSAQDHLFWIALPLPKWIMDYRYNVLLSACCQMSRELKRNQNTLELGFNSHPSFIVW